MIKFKSFLVNSPLESGGSVLKKGKNSQKPSQEICKAFLKWKTQSV